ncbi:MAG: zf-HC2 domain-containing protein [Acidimicrobiia bacterium]|nr:zf-HC2 domain-containing protein [Acidimicrobiia bacterium]
MNGVPERTTELLSAYLDGELTKPELREVVDILEHDRAAIAAFRAIQATRRAVRTLPTLDPPRHLIPGGHLGDQLSAYVDGELATAEIPVVSAHLDTCSDCRHELADIDRSRTAVRALPGVEPPEFLTPRVEDHDTVVPFRRRRSTRTAVAIAAGAAAVSLVVALTPIGGSDTPAAVSITELGSRHDARASTGVVPSGVEVGLP